MAQLSDDCFAHGDSLMRLDDALDLLLSKVGRVADAETCPIVKAAGRILAEDVVSAISVPPHRNSAVDGYAVYFDDMNPHGETRLPVTARVTAGHPLARPMARGEAVRIFTGAAMPDGADGGGPDVVMMQEDCQEEDGLVVIMPGIERGANRREAGEDIKQGSTILKAGRRLRPPDIGLAASVGRAELPVYRRLRAAIFSTGDEIHEPGGALPSGGIYDANRYVLRALLEGLGATVTDAGILPDEESTIRDTLSGLAEGNDVIVTSGGMSVGEEDHVKAAVEALGALHFWRLAIKPGRPVALGQVGRVPFVGLPGNPVAVMVTFLRIARPLLLRLGGAVDLSPHLYRVRAAFDHRKKRNRREWVRASLHAEADGSLSARKFARQGAGILSSVVEADGLVELPEDLTYLESGTMVDFLPFTEVGS